MTTLPRPRKYQALRDLLVMTLFRGQPLGEVQAGGFIFLWPEYAALLDPGVVREVKQK